MCLAAPELMGGVIAHLVSMGLVWLASSWHVWSDGLALVGWAVRVEMSRAGVEGWGVALLPAALDLAWRGVRG